MMVTNFDRHSAQSWLLRCSAGCPAGTDSDFSGTYEQQRCEAVLVQKRCVFSVLAGDEAMEGIPHQTVVAYQHAQHYCLFSSILVCMYAKQEYVMQQYEHRKAECRVRSEAQAFKYSTVSS